MNAARRLAALLGLLVLPAACGRSCGCVEGEKTYETLNGKYKVELVRNVHWPSGRNPAPRTDFMVRVHTSPAFDEPIVCSHVDLAEDDAGRFVGYRCHEQKLWTILRLRGADRRIVECDAPVGAGRRPDFKQLGTLSASVDRILDCATAAGAGNTAAAWSELATSIAEDEGTVAAALFLARSAERPLRDDVGDAWDVALAKAPTAVRDAALAAVCAAFTSGEASPQLYARGARSCSLDGIAVGDGAVVQLRRVLKMDLTDGMQPSHDVALGWASAIAAEKAPVDAGEVACAAIPAVSAHDTRAAMRVDAIAVVIARTKSKCSAISGWFAKAPCSDELDCDGGLCDYAHLAAGLEGWGPSLKSAPGERLAPVPMRPDRIRLAALLVQGKPDREIVIRNARRHYATAVPDGGAEAPACNEDRIADGVPCRCDRDLASFACEVPAAETRQSRGACAFHIDDARRRFDDVRRTSDAGVHDARAD